jgi:hypothetical protein
MVINRGMAYSIVLAPLIVTIEILSTSGIFARELWTMFKPSVSRKILAFKKYCSAAVASNGVRETRRDGCGH